MGKLQEARASAVIADGAMRAIPGFSDASKFADQQCFQYQSGEVTLHTADTGAKHVIPFNATIVYAGLVPTEAPGTDAGTINVGVEGDADSILDAYSIATGVTPDELVDVTDELETTEITAGQAIQTSTGGEATSTGKACLVLLYVPRV